ncbi:MAG: hypothetical protein HKO66_12370 [Saprospiraceae bacterium]|nr:hypothetical protein [Bacteroidia bacterium]NNE14460.1 hypothetical protein [Saprospiraceae bacterium]NNL93025.1 hypothetical protein [Saprospiraceae bacterium]
MASQSSNLKKLKNGRKIVMNSVKTIHNGVLETADTLIEETVNSGVKYQKLATKAIKKTEPLLDKQVDLFFDTAEAIYTQIQTGNKRFQKLLGITKTVKNAKSTVNKTVKMASKKLEENFEMASSAIKTVADRVEDNLEKLGSNIKVTTQKVEEKATEVKKTAAKKTKTVSKRAKSTVAKAKKAVKKAPAKRKASAKKVTARRKSSKATK